MDFLDHMKVYFRAEQLTGVGVAVLGLVLLIASVWLWFGLRDGFARGLGVTLLVLALGALVGGAGLAWKTPRQVAGLSQSYQQNGVGVVAVEGERMEKVVANFRLYRIIFYVAIVAALGLLLFVNTPVAIGVAAGLLFAAIVGITVDTYAEHRAQVYLNAILALP